MTDSIVILTECGEKIGFGHLTRCLSLAQQFQHAGLGVELWVAGDGMAQGHLPKTARSVQWYDPSEDAVQKMEMARGVLIDSYLASPDQIERIRAINSRLAVIDDYCRRRYESGIVIDWTIGAEKRSSGKCSGEGSSKFEGSSSDSTSRKTVRENWRKMKKRFRQIGWKY